MSRDEWTRAEFQEWIDDVQATVVAKSAEATGVLNAIAVEYGLADWTEFMAAQPVAPAAAADLSAAEWTMLQRAAQNVDFVDQRRFAGRAQRRVRRGRPGQGRAVGEVVRPRVHDRGRPGLPRRRRRR